MFLETWKHSTQRDRASTLWINSSFFFSFHVKLNSVGYRVYAVNTFCKIFVFAYRRLCLASLFTKACKRSQKLLRRLIGSWRWGKSLYTLVLQFSLIIVLIFLTFLFKRLFLVLVLQLITVVRSMRLRIFNAIYIYIQWIYLHTITML